LNEVGGEPQQFGLSVERFHQRNLQRQRDWPASLLSTSSHDTKRSQDVRARMLAISEIPQLWGRSLQKWRTANRRFKRRVDEIEAPNGNEEYLLYQTLLGTWPIDLTGAAVPTVSTEFVARIQQYMAKALKEAKLNTSWIQPNAEWDNAMSEFIAKILEPSPRNKFIPAFLPVAEEIARLGMINSLAQTIVKITTPGVPDIYQGTEIWDDSLVDPDNRRPVDYARRREMLAGVRNTSPEELLRCWPDGRIKLRVVQRLLHLRRENAGLFREGNYEALSTHGTLAGSIVGFMRKQDEKAVVILVPRISSRVGFPPIGERWGDTGVAISESMRSKLFRDVFTNREIKAENSDIRLADVMSEFPFAVFESLS